MDLSGTHDFLLTFHSNHGPNCTVSEINGDLSRKLQIFPTSRVFCASTDGVPLGIGYRCKGCYYSGSVLLSLPVSSPPLVSDRAAFSPLLCSAVQLTGLWSELPPELVSHWATTTLLTWIMQITLSSSLTKWMTLEVFETTASQLGLHVSWQKTKIQNLGAGESTPCLPVCGHSLAEVTKFTYLGSVQSTTGRCQPDIIRWMGIASTDMHSMNKVWRQTRL